MAETAFLLMLLVIERVITLETVLFVAFLALDDELAFISTSPGPFITAFDLDIT
ncbi:4266_t:CDS:1, partial [Racocetra fulgida]